MINGTDISVMRTGAVPGLAARYLARPESETLAMIGCGPIARSALAGLLCTCRQIGTVKMYSIHRESTEANRKLLQERYPTVSFVLADSVEAAVRDSDVVSFATSGAEFPYVNEEWLKPGVFCSIPSDINMDEAFITGSARNVIDNWNMYEAWSEELPEPYIDNMPLIGTYMYKYVTEGKMDREKVTELKDIVTGKTAGRVSEDEKIVLGMGGQCIYDVAWAEEIYRAAVKTEIGTVLQF